jgi:hypothetical protein
LAADESIISGDKFGRGRATVLDAVNEGSQIPTVV